MSIRQFLKVAVACLAVAPSAALAQSTFPDRPLRVVVPFTPGSIVEIIARQIADRLTVSLGQPVLIESLPGGAGAIGAQKVARSEPDGYTLLFPSSSLVVADVVNPGQIDARATLVPVSSAAEAAAGVFINNDVPAGTIAELIAYAKENPGQIRYGSSGIGSITHLFGALFGELAGLDMVHIPYQGGAPTITATISGEVHMAILAYGAGKPQSDSGQIKLLAIGAGEREAEMPDVPTVDESGLPGYFATVWTGFFAPAGTPDEIVETLNREIQTVLAQPDFVAEMKRLGYQAKPMSRAGFAAQVDGEFDQWTRTAASAGIGASAD